MASVFKRDGDHNYSVAWFDHLGRRRERSTRTTDHRAAERIGSKLETDAALRREGVIDARQDSVIEQEREPLSQHVDAYLAHMKHAGRAPKHVSETGRMLRRLVTETGAGRLSELTVDRVERSIRTLRNAGRSAQTCNLVRMAAVAFMSWCEKTDRVADNALKRLPRLDAERGRMVRRALTEDELVALLAVAGKYGRRAWYLTAALAGLRRSELVRLRWGSVDLEAGTLTISDGKAHRTDVLPLHPQLAAELASIRPALALPTAAVFPHPVPNSARKRDFTEAKIDRVDAGGRVADLHSLRTTLGTALARQGVTPQIASRLMRHGDVRLTMKHYTALGLVDTAGAILRVPGVPDAVVGERQQATGTDGAAAADQRPQECPQPGPQTAHDPSRSVAAACEGDAAEGAQAISGNPVLDADLCDVLQLDAARRDGVSDGNRTRGLQCHRLAL
jgi:integrase